MQNWVISNEPGHLNLCLMSYANDKGVDQPAHPRSLISAFIVRCLDSVMSLVSVTKISSLMLASVAEQAGLSLTGLETPEDTFSHDVAHLEIHLPEKFIQGSWFDRWQLYCSSCLSSHLSLFEPSHEIMALSILHKLILLTRMHSHPVGLDIWSLVGPFVYFHTLRVWTAKASLVAYVISTIISWANSFIAWKLQLYNQAAARQNQHNDMCLQWRLRSASACSDQSSLCTP